MIPFVLWFLIFTFFVVEHKNCAIGEGSRGTKWNNSKRPNHTLGPWPRPCRMYSRTETSKWFLNKCNMCHLHQKSVLFGKLWSKLSTLSKTSKKNTSSPFKNNIVQNISPQDFVEILHGNPHQHFKIQPICKYYIDIKYYYILNTYKFG